MEVDLVAIDEGESLVGSHHHGRPHHQIHRKLYWLVSWWDVVYYGKIGMEKHTR